MSFQICVFDDDKYPDGRATRVVEKLNRDGINAILVTSWRKLKEGLLNGTVSRSMLFVLDSSIEEPGSRIVDFCDTLPWLVGAGGLEPWQLMPGSGGARGCDNNEYFSVLMETTKYHVSSVKQMGISSSGLSGNTDRVAMAIEDYYNEIESRLRDKEITSEISNEYGERGL